MKNEAQDEQDEKHSTRPILNNTVDESTYRQILFASETHVGQKRQHNEDSAFGLVTSTLSTSAIKPRGIFIVADGMGGHQNGEVASALAVDLISKRLIDYLLNEKSYDEDAPTKSEVLYDVMREANSTIKELVPGGGTTATVVMIEGDLATVSHVGDSRAYLYHNGVLEQITRDHSKVQRLVELGELSPEEAEKHPETNLLYRAMGKEDDLDPDILTRRVLPGSRLLVCSDGLWNVVGNDLLTQILDYHSDDPRKACNKLVQAANLNGGPDNIAVILAQFFT